MGGISEREGQLQRGRVKHSERDGNLGGGWGLQGGGGDLRKELQRRGRGFREQLQGRTGASMWGLECHVRGGGLREEAEAH